jgi:hypothetical protein
MDTWRKLTIKYNVRECKICTALIANNLDYGRKASKSDKDICEICKLHAQYASAILCNRV